MVRWGLRLFFLSLPLFTVGFAGSSSGWFEIARLGGAGCLALGLALLLLDHFLTPDPENG